MRRISELKTLRNLRPCVDDDLMCRVDGRLENAELPIEAKHSVTGLFMVFLVLKASFQNAVNVCVGKLHLFDN